MVRGEKNEVDQKKKGRKQTGDMTEEKDQKWKRLSKIKVFPIVVEVGLKRCLKRSTKRKKIKA